MLSVVQLCWNQKGDVEKIQSHMSDTLKIQHKPNINKLYSQTSLPFVPNFHQPPHFTKSQLTTNTPFLSMAVKAWLGAES